MFKLNLSTSPNVTIPYDRRTSKTEQGTPATWLQAKVDIALYQARRARRR